jgi:uncharacterized repeat protein (TIGR03987 family)
MKPILIAGTIIVNLALIAYTLFIFAERKNKKVVGKVLLFITIGVILDTTATVCMIAGSTKSPFTLHGILGYSSLAGMLTDAFLIWKCRLRDGMNSPLSRAVHNYSLIAYFWWITAYITGAMLVMMR